MTKEEAIYALDRTVDSLLILGYDNRAARLRDVRAFIADFGSTPDGKPSKYSAFCGGIISVEGPENKQPTGASVEDRMRDFEDRLSTVETELSNLI